LKNKPPPVSDANPPLLGKILVLYDGVCGLCNRAVQFILKRDRCDQFRFASLQSDIARKILLAQNLQPDRLDTMYLVISHGAPTEHLLSRSDAALAIGKRLGGFWGILAAAGRLLPGFLRDFLYNAVARNRYRIFGKHDTCPIPTPEQCAKFLA
jgi:predicted DCC family thiol-disulfide oxidoreductase YuxK